MDKLYSNKVLKIFMIVQPIIDIITSIMINELNLSISLGMILRFIFLIYILGYLFINKNKKIFIFIGICILYCLINLIGNYLLIDNFNIIKQSILLIKMFYFPMVLLFYLSYFKKNKELDNKVFITISLLIGLSLVVSYLTHTSYCTYVNYEDCYKNGIVSWFNSGNEYGLILIALLGFNIAEFIKKSTIANTISLLLIIIFLCVLGTKASFVGVIGVLSIYSIYYLFIAFFNRKKAINLKKIIFLVCIVFIIGISIKSLPIYTNLSYKYELAVISATEDCEDYCMFKNEEEINEEVQQSLIFNGRNDFLNMSKKLYKESNIFHKLFGITNQGNYIDGIAYTIFVERDIHDLIIYYGIFGLLIILLIPGYILIKVLLTINKNKKILLDENIFIYGLVCALLLFGSYLAGHCFFQPAVSIYLAYLLTIIYKKVSEHK